MPSLIFATDPGPCTAAVHIKTSIWRKSDDSEIRPRATFSPLNLLSHCGIFLKSEALLSAHSGHIWAELSA